jgi:hypothetical protein
VVQDENGKANTVRFQAVNAMLLNELLKEHHKVQEQKATIGQLKKGIETIVACILSMTLNQSKSGMVLPQRGRQSYKNE